MKKLPKMEISEHLGFEQVGCDSTDASQSAVVCGPLSTSSIGLEELIRDALMEPAETTSGRQFDETMAAIAISWR